MLYINKTGKKIHKTGTLGFYYRIFQHFYCVFHIMRSIGPDYYSQSMEWHNSGIATLKHAIYAPNIFSKFPENQITNSFIYLTSPNFVTV